MRRLQIEQLEPRLALSSFNLAVWQAEMARLHPKMASASNPITVTMPVPPGTQSVTVTMNPAPVAQSKPVGAQAFYGVADASIHYAQAYSRYDWRTIEPSLGSYNFSSIDSDLAAAKAAGRGFSFRIMPWEKNVAGPDAYRSLAGTQTTFVEDGQAKWQPNLNDAKVQLALGNLIAALGRRYGGDPALSSVDIGFYGAYGEYGTYGQTPVAPRPTTATTEWLINQLKAAFPHSYVIVQASLATDDSAAFAYAMAQGCGWRGDSWGNFSVNGSWADQEAIYAPCIAAAPNQWKIAPVILEPYGTMSSWPSANIPRAFDFAINQAHCWLWSNKGAAIPANCLPYVNQLLAMEAAL